MKIRKASDQKKCLFYVRPKVPQDPYFVSSNSKSFHLGKNLKMKQALISPEYLPTFQQRAGEGFQTWTGHGAFVFHSGFPFYDVVWLHFEHTSRSPIDGDKKITVEIWL